MNYGERYKLVLIERRDGVGRAYLLGPRGQLELLHERPREGETDVQTNDAYRPVAAGD